MHYGRNRTLLGNARSLWKDMTKEERHLWFDFLRYCRPRFRRQEIIGSYILDFFVTKQSLLWSWTVPSTAKHLPCGTMRSGPHTCVI